MKKSKNWCWASMKLTWKESLTGKAALARATKNKRHVKSTLIEFLKVNPKNLDFQKIKITKRTANYVFKLYEKDTK
jgi:hypothetical protein